MLEDLQQFGNLSMAHRAGGAPVELERSKDEVVFLAFDNRIRRLVELHVLRGGSSLDAVGKRSAFDRARLASEIRNHTFMRILELGEDEGLVYYTSNLNDGEFVDHYVYDQKLFNPTMGHYLSWNHLDYNIWSQVYDMIKKKNLSNINDYVDLLHNITSIEI